MVRVICIILGIATTAFTPVYSAEPVSRDDDDEQAGKMNQSAALETVKRWAGDKLIVSIYEEVAIPGVSLFTYTSAPHERIRVYDLTPARWGLLYRHGDAKILGGEDALQAVLDAGVNDPEDVARLALLFLKENGVITDDAGKPYFQDGVLVFFWRRDDMGRELMKASLDCKSLALTVEPVLEAD